MSIAKDHISPKKKSRNRNKDQHYIGNLKRIIFVYTRTKFVQTNHIKPKKNYKIIRYSSYELADKRRNDSIFSAVFFILFALFAFIQLFTLYPQVGRALEKGANGSQIAQIYFHTLFI